MSANNGIEVAAGHALSKEAYDEIVPGLREALVNAQYDVTQQRDFAVLVLLAGMSGSGRSETANRLSEWMDPRYVHLRALDEPTGFERARPHMWRYWQALPPKGSIGVLLESWYHAPVVKHASSALSGLALQRSLAEIRDFETLLVHEGVLLLKLWFHLEEAAQVERLQKLSASKLTRWRVTDEDRWQLKHYEAFSAAAKNILGGTGSVEAPWTIIDGSDEQYREVAVGRLLHEALRRRLDTGIPDASVAPALPERRRKRNPLHELDLNKRLDKADYQKQLEEQQARLARLTRRNRFRKRSLVVVFEGMDAAGKGSAIRRITYALDVRQYTVVPIAAPSEEELRYPYLWRFWRALPKQGEITIFDRSWYGRVLVERVENLADAADWQRAYEEINAFEQQLIESGTLVVKFWLQISKAGQLKRFREREETPFKRFKITPDDWRNRRKWDAYQQAAADMIERTSTAPWTLIEAEDKYYARIKVLRTLVEKIESALD
ncbi:MAG TPA: polyphosphate:AMP phosphotransferase [Burkholderiales bacterium]|jgi:polyphosphate:AMP phosphotransferase